MKPIEEQGYVIMALNTPQVDYLDCARTLTKTIKQWNPHASVCLITDQTHANDPIYNHYRVIENIDRNNLYANDWQVHEVDLDGPATSVDVRAVGWAEVAVMKSSVSPETEWGDYVVSREGAQAWARVDDSGIHVRVKCGQVRDAVVLRSFCIGAAHMALGWVRSEGIAVNESGEPVDLSIRSLGVIRAADTPLIEIEIIDDDGPSINGSDAVFAAVAAAAWRAAGFASTWPCQR